MRYTSLLLHNIGGNIEHTHICCHESDVWSKALIHCFTSSNLMWSNGNKNLSVATRTSWITLCVPGVNCFLAGHSLWRNAGQILRCPRDRQNKNAWCIHCVYIEAAAPASWRSREHPKFNLHSWFSPKIYCHSLVKTNNVRKHSRLCWQVTTSTTRYYYLTIHKILGRVAQSV
jgi:hypothetical protein